VDDRLARLLVARNAVGMPVRPVLLPGAPLLRRDAHHLQVGTSPGIVFTDRPGLVPLLRLLDGLHSIDSLQELAAAFIPDLREPVANVLTELLAIGALVDGVQEVATTRRRAAHRIAFDDNLDARQIVAATRTVIQAGGISQLASPDPDLLIFASCGEAPRAGFEQAVQLGRDHLPVVIDQDRVRIGPFVRPGRSPCVGCHDLHRTDWDSAWPALLHQFGHPATSLYPPILDPLTLHAAAVEIAAEVFAHADGSTPRTIGHCLVVGPDHDERTIWPIGFHHRCACDLLIAA
jgi:hypothetical protein